MQTYDLGTPYPACSQDFEDAEGLSLKISKITRRLRMAREGVYYPCEVALLNG